MKTVEIKSAAFPQRLRTSGIQPCLVKPDNAFARHYKILDGLSGIINAHEDSRFKAVDMLFTMK